MILGIGTDIVQIPRIEKVFSKYGDDFAKRILTKSELESYHQKASNDRASHLAKRFAAKEAISKAFGVGIGKDIRFHDIEISNDQSGKPEVDLFSEIGENKTIFLSISDDYPIAVAFAVISRVK